VPLVDAEPDLEVRSTLAAFTRIFAEHVDRLEIWQRVLEGWNVEDSPVILEWIRQGEVRGRIEEARAILLRLGRRQFGRVTKATRTALESIVDLERLERMSERLLEVESWQDLLATP
jgi:hypothetical protein